MAISFLLVAGVVANETAEYYLGEWNMLIEGTPNGDSNMHVVIKKEDGGWSGYIDVPESDGDDIVFESIEVDGDELLFTFFSQGFHVEIWLEKENANKAVGYLLDSFDVTATRIINE